MALYASTGFRETGEHEVVPRLWTVSYRFDSMRCAGA
jgi:hypothetical protein